MCRGQLGPARQLEVWFTSLSAAIQPDADATAKHVLYNQLASYVDNKMDNVDRKIVDAHVEICSVCAEELRDLQAFKASIATQRKGHRRLQEGPRSGEEPPIHGVRLSVRLVLFTGCRAFPPCPALRSSARSVWQSLL
jgi:hypothetical protein